MQMYGKFGKFPFNSDLIQDCSVKLQILCWREFKIHLRISHALQVWYIYLQICHVGSKCK